MSLHQVRLLEISRLDDVRWVVEDAMKFVKREARRGNTYNGIILDPENAFCVLNLYSNGFSAVLAETIARTAFTGIKSPENGELVLRDRYGKCLPLSVFVRLKR